MKNIITKRTTNEAELKGVLRGLKDDTSAYIQQNVAQSSMSKSRWKGYGS